MAKKGTFTPRVEVDLSRVSELKERRYRDVAKEAQHFKGISPALRDFSEKISSTVARRGREEDEDETTTMALRECIYETKRKPLSLAGARLPQTRNGLEKSGKKERATHAHTAVKEKGRGGGETPRRGRTRFVMSKSIVLAVLVVESLISKWGGLVSPPWFAADVGRFNPRTRSTWYQTRWHEEKEEEESPSSYFADTLQRAVLQGIPKLCVPHFSFTTNPLPQPSSFPPSPFAFTEGGHASLPLA